MLLTIVQLILSFVLLTLGADVLVRGATRLALRLGLSTFFVGVTIVGFGTSTPELATSIAAALEGLSDICVGNVVGSNIMNLALILGVTAMVCPVPIRERTVRTQVAIVIATSFVPYVALTTGGAFTRLQGVVMVIGLVVFLWGAYRSGRKDMKALEAVAEEAAALDTTVGSGAAADAERPHPPLVANLFLAALGLAALIAGSQLMVDSAVVLARAMGVSELVIALTIVAGGTSAPELFTSVVAALRKEADLSIGNLLGSSIFNILAILGITSLVRPPSVNEQVLWLDAPVMILVSLACVPLLLKGSRITRAEGALLFVFYLAYLVVLFRFAPGWFGP